MSECTATFRQYHTRHFWGVLPGSVFAGFSVLVLGLSIDVLFGRYETLSKVFLWSVSVTVGWSAYGFVHFEVFRRVGHPTVRRLRTTDGKVPWRRKCIPILAICFVDIVVVIQHVDLWKTGLASWHSRRCVQAERYEDALAWADEYLRFAPRSPEAYHNRAAVYSKLDESELALADYIRAADVDQTRWDTVELLLDQLIEHERAELFWKIYDLAQPHHAKHAAHYLSTRRDLPNRPPGVAAPADAEPKGTEPHEPDESGQLV